MLPLNHLNRAAPFGWAAAGGVLALAVPLPKAPEITGLSRSCIYREAAKGNLKLIKVGRSTLLCLDSARQFLATLPQAKIGAAGKEAA